MSGDEYGIVILSTVRSLPKKEIANPNHVQADRGWLFENLGFLTDAHQLNVGITRSKYGLIIVGELFDSLSILVSLFTCAFILRK